MKQKKTIALLLVLCYLLLSSSSVLAVDFSRADASLTASFSSYAEPQKEVHLEKVLKNKDEEIAKKFANAKKWLKERTPEIGKFFNRSLAKWKAEAQKMVELIREKFNELRDSYHTLL